jgi:soluble lytic murein transglycosylase-like protein
MPVEGVYQNIESILQRIENIQNRFGSPPRVRPSFSESLQKAEAGETGGARNSTGTAGANGAGAAAKNAAGTASAFGSAEPAAGASGAGDGIYDAIIRRASEQFRIPEPLIRAVIQQESGFNQSAVSPKGAMGLMQLMPQTAALLGVSNPFDPAQNIMGGTRYLKDLLQQYGGNLNNALAAYNAGPHRVRNAVPDIPETVNFVDAVLRRYEKFSAQGE